MHDQVRGALLGLISCMRFRLRRMLAATNLGEFLHPARRRAEYSLLIQMPGEVQVS